MTKVTEILDKINSFLSNTERKSEYFTKETAFTRNRCLGLENLGHFMLFNGNRSLSIALAEYFESTGTKSCSKSAFSKARYQIKPAFFSDWYKHSVGSIYEQGAEMPNFLKKWNGFRLKRIDGSSLYLFKDELIEEEFGGQTNQFGIRPMARIGVEIDLLNGYCTFGAD